MQDGAAGVCAAAAARHGGVVDAVSHAPPEATGFHQGATSDLADSRPDLTCTRIQ